jgi:hypothetical protein
VQQCRPQCIVEAPRLFGRETRRQLQLSIHG